MPAAPIHHTAIDDSGSWDGGAVEKAFNGSTVGEFDALYAWVDTSDTDANGDLNRSAGWGPHHDVGSDGKPGAANMKGVAGAVGALNGARGGGSTIPEADRGAVYAHLKAHYADAGVKDEDIPELKSAEQAMDALLAGASAEFEKGRAEIDALILDRARARARRNKKPRHRAHPLLPEYRRAAGGFEVRHYDVSGLEVREARSGDTVDLHGVPIVYDTPYEVLDMFGSFTETMRSSVGDVVASPGLDCRFLINHSGLPLARTVAGTLALNSTPVGLEFTAPLSLRQQAVNDLIVAIERGDVTQMSCGFVVDRDNWNEDYTEREILSFAELLDISAVTYPASPTTSIEVMNRMMMEVPVESRARVRRLWAFATELRAGKVLSAENAEHIANAAKALMAVAENAGLDLGDDEDDDDDSLPQPDSGTPQGDGVDPAASAGPGQPDGAGSRTAKQIATTVRDIRSLAGLGTDQDALLDLVDKLARRQTRDAVTSFDDIENAVQRALIEKYGGDDGDPDLWVVDCMTDGTCVFCSYVKPPGTGYWLTTYTLDGDGVATLSADDPIEVIEQTAWVPVDEDAQRSATAAAELTALALERDLVRLRRRSRRRR